LPTKLYNHIVYDQSGSQEIHSYKWKGSHYPRSCLSTCRSSIAIHCFLFQTKDDFCTFQCAIIFPLFLLWLTRSVHFTLRKEGRNNLQKMSVLVSLSFIIRAGHILVFFSIKNLIIILVFYFKEKCFFFFANNYLKKCKNKSWSLHLFPIPPWFCHIPLSHIFSFVFLFLKCNFYISCIYLS
jgi:hypothetical protein